MLRGTLQRSVSLGSATFLVVSSVIGSGIFFTPGVIAGLLPRADLILAVWVVGGLLSLCGALANAELGTMFPRAGGNYVFLREAFHPLAGFLAGWLTFFVIYVGTIATLSVAFAMGFIELFGITEVMASWLAIIIILTISAVNFVGVRWGALANDLTASFKLGSMLMLVFSALFFGRGADSSSFLPPPTLADLPPLTAFGAALSTVLFSYLGWNASLYVAGEIKNPGRNIPASLFIGLAVCTFIYFAMNTVYFYALPVEQQRGVENAGIAAATALFGPIGGHLVGLLVLGSILGTLNAMILIGPRIAYAMAVDGLFFRGVEVMHPRFGTPHIAIVVQAIMVIVLLLITERYPANILVSVLSYTTFAILLATVADITALYVLRWRQPYRHRPYSAWGYPWLPAFYMIANVGIAISLLVTQTVECLLGLLVTLIGIPFYLVLSYRR
ncbi:MAG: amino acid permease [Candidatus Thiosymbion ectosymbiont of Robbea hypermnestra]|nr:amino acid permease [Candidatus Thiosymbion ectosymbiont of Robbea hypermnestra]